MKDLIILGAGGTGASLLSIVNDINERKAEWNVLGFLDDNNSLLNKKLAGKDILGTINDAYKYKDAYYISSIAHPNNRMVRRLVYDRVKSMGCKFAILIHPTAVVSTLAEIKEGCVIFPLCFIDALVKIDEDVFITCLSSIGHETYIKSHCTISANVKLSGGIVVNSDCYISAGVSAAHDITIGENTLIAIGSSVVNNIEGNGMWIGVPAIADKKYGKITYFLNKNIKKKK